MLVVNNTLLLERAEIIREKGTNRSKFFRGEIDKYGWVDIGSSFLPSDIIAAFLYAQLENIDVIQARRKYIWETYFKGLSAIKSKVKLPCIPKYGTNNGHMFYLVCKNENERKLLIDILKNAGYQSVFHYQSLHQSKYFERLYTGKKLS